jgi:hypothetical protein
MRAKNYASKSYRKKRIAKRKSWSQQAHAAKARHRLEKPQNEPEPQPKRQPLPWKITVTNLIDGETGSFQPRSGRHAKQIIDLLFSQYRPKSKNSIRLVPRVSNVNTIKN